MLRENWFIDKLHAIGWTPTHFANTTGYDKRSVFSWARSTRNIPVALCRPLYNALSFAVDEEHGDSPNSSAKLHLSGLKGRLGHYAPKSGRRVMPSMGLAQ